jgi:hypothetical protein
MSNRSQSSEAADRTALISILRESRRAGPDLDADDYSILISFVGSVLLPPYLPRIHAQGHGFDRKGILDKIQELGRLYSASYADHEISQDEALALSLQLKGLGYRVFHHLSEFKKVVLSLADFRVKNVIILTDDYEIPWSLSCFGSGTEFRFLSSEFPCGTLLVDDADEALSRLRKHNASHRQVADVPSRTKRVRIVCGDLGGGERDSGLAFQYAERLATFFSDTPTCDFDVKCFGPREWRGLSGRPKELVVWLSSELEKADIVHYIGHVKDGFLWFDDRTMISSKLLSDSLDPLDGRPLVVLQACEAANVSAGKDAGSHLCKVFLEKGASGCIAPVLPISIPTRLERFDETLIALFYRNIIENIPYGRSLANAQSEHQKKWAGDPQGFFFQLFGDPRAVWRPSIGLPSHLALIARAVAESAPVSSRLIMRVSCEGAGLSETTLATELLAVLRTTPQIESYQEVARARQLGVSEIVREMAPYMVIMLSTLSEAGGKDAIKVFVTEIAKLLAQRLLHAGSERQERGGGRDGKGKRSSRVARSTRHMAPLGTIKIDVGKLTVIIRLIDGKFEITTESTGEVGQFA